MAAAPKRDNTMEATAKEAAEILSRPSKECSHDLASDLGVEKGEDHKNGEAENATAEVNGVNSDEKPSPEKQGTMVATAAEGEKILEELGGAPKKEAKTRSQAKKDEDDEPEAKKPKRDSTMVATAKEGKELLNEEELGASRSETEATKEAEEEQPTPKRDSTMQKTAQEGKEFLEKSNWNRFKIFPPVC